MLVMAQSGVGILWSKKGEVQEGFEFPSKCIFLNNITESGSRKKGTIKERDFVVVVDK